MQPLSTRAGPRSGASARRVALAINDQQLRWSARSVSTQKRGLWQQKQGLALYSCAALTKAVDQSVSETHEDEVLCQVDESGSLVCHSLCKGSYSIRKVASNRIKQGVFARDRSGQQREMANGNWVLDNDAMRLCSVDEDGVLLCENLEPGEYIISREDTNVDADGNVLQFPPKEEVLVCERDQDGSVSCKLN